MAVAITGTPVDQLITVTGGVNDLSITVPSDCTLVLVAYGFYVNTGCDMSSATINSVSLTKAVSRAGVSSVNGGCGFWTLANPSTGSQTLHTVWTTSGTWPIFVVYLKGVNTTSPVRNTGTSTIPGTPGNYYTGVTPNMSALTGDMAFAVGFDYTNDANAADAAPSGSGQTVLCGPTYNGSYGGALGYKAISSDGNTTTSFVGNYNGMLGCVIATADVTIQIAVASLVYTGQAVNVNAKSVLSLAVASVLYTGQVLTVSGNQILQMAVASLAYTGKALKINEYFILAKSSIVYTGKVFTANAMEFVSVVNAVIVYTGNVFKLNEIIKMGLTRIYYSGLSLRLGGVAGEILRRSKWLVSFVGYGRRRP